MQPKYTLWLAAAVGVITATALIAGCGSKDDAKSSGNSETKPAATAAAEKDSGGGSSGKSETITVEMKDNLFAPKDITVERGEAVTFIAKNTGQAVHNMVIQSGATQGKDFMSDAMVNPGAESKFTATFTKAGTVKFVCAYHPPDMVGTITVK